MKVTDEISQKIYTLAKNPDKNLTNQQIADKFGITEGSVRHHIRKWESTIQTVARNDKKINTALAAHTLDVIAESLMQNSVIKQSIKEARDRNVSPDKLSGLFGNWIRALELASELLGDIDRAPTTNIQLNQEYIELKSIVLGALCPQCKDAIKAKLRGL